MDILLAVLGLVALLGGGELLVTGAVATARRLSVPPMIIGLTLVGFGTSAPELVTSLRAAFAGSPGIALGNVVGSNIANILLILGLAALLRPLAVDRTALIRDGRWVAGAALACAALVFWPVIGRGAGAALVAGLALFLFLTLRSEGGGATATEEAGTPAPLWNGLVRAAAGLVLTVVGAFALVDGASGLARSAGISEAVIGLTLVAVGTSLPELVTSLLAARRGHGDVALGNILGSNVFNILGILGLTALARPLPVDPQIAGFDIYAMLGATVLLLVFAATGRRVTRVEGGVLLAVYAGYLAILSRTF
ncbi:calcium/sodium antiporter [Roseivivax isoporae]|uniref:Sodium:calcium antiporter n=1 Tax=Roseivivax isoporae LMG 25204 TaxID=1449351 RepID=X7FBU3_9RHOB|nr:calcium/sodium antiporter [Roseivivax isoporae]ETX29541.1 sodium:calcium antiporter [Roseivivax isoporae LMG 25204]